MEFGKQYMEHAKANKSSWLRDRQIMTHLATVNRELALLKHMFNMAEQWGFCRARNPVKGLKFLAENNIQLRSLSDEEEALLLRHCSPNPQDLVVLSINTGLRHSDILNLKLLGHSDIKIRCATLIPTRTPRSAR